MPEQLTVFYEGRVQGVGFRATVLDLSQNFEVTGFVRNCFDGRVELLAEGEPAVLVGFHNAIKSRMHRNIASATEDWKKIQANRFDSFSIETSVP